jgi:hypothetical protein
MALFAHHRLHLSGLVAPFVQEHTFVEELYASCELQLLHEG